MTQQVSKAQPERQVAQAERQELKAELTEQAAYRPRRPGNRRRTITLIVFAVVAVLVGLVSVFTLLPSSTPSSGGVPVGAVAPTFRLPVYGGEGSGSIDLQALLGINQADPKEDIAPFGREYSITYPLLFDPGGTVNAAYAVTAIPTTYFIDSQGVVRSVFVTQLSQKTMRQGLASVGMVIP